MPLLRRLLRSMSAFPRKWERNAAPPNDRIAALRAFHERGIFTWVSLEPTLDIEASLAIVEATHSFVDFYKIGRVNYLKEMTQDYRLARLYAAHARTLSRVGARHYIKKDLQPFLPPGYPNPLRVPQHHGTRNLGNRYAARGEQRFELANLLIAQIMFCLKIRPWSFMFGVRYSEPVLQAKSAPIPRAVYQSDRIADNENSKDRLRQRLATVCNAWDDFQECRRRDAVYGYLKAVFALVLDCKGRRRTKRLLRRAFQFAGLQFDKNADPFAAVIRCTSERRIDNKSISKWARALRYVAYCKVPQKRLKTFMKKMGGINGCADRHTKYFGRGTR